MSSDDEQALAKLVTSGIKIPAQPQVLLDLQKSLAADNYSVRSLANLIGQDPGLVAMLFKAVRSPVFGRGKNIDSLEQALMVIGVKHTYNLVQAVALASSVSDGSRKAFDIFWTRSREIAQISAIVAADRLSVCNVSPDQAYMAGIFHECGVPVLMLRYPQYCASLHLDDVCCWPNLAEEDAKFDVDHCSVGYLVARHWNLPDFVCAAIRYHHEIPQDELGASRTLIANLQLAVHIHHGMNRNPDPLWGKIGPQVLHEMGIHPEEETEYEDEILERFHGA